MNNRYFSAIFTKFSLICSIIFLSDIISSQTTITVSLHDQSADMYHVSASGKVVSEDSYLKIFTDANAAPVSIPFTSIRKIAFSTLSSTDDRSNEVSDIRIFPNPAKDHVIILDENNPSMDVSISTILGQQILSGKYNSGEKVSVSELEPGVYVTFVNKHAFSIFKN
ncbi:MAG TPA: hypothetical protein DCQ58_10280 [Saprospirales bacterium]|nr:hypothetical protein [Saprospirales bacterium]